MFSGFLIEQDVIIIQNDVWGINGGGISYAPGGPTNVQPLVV